LEESDCERTVRLGTCLFLRLWPNWFPSLASLGRCGTLDLSTSSWLMTESEK
jgi:hypothetical protein